MPQIPIVGDAYKTLSGAFAAETCINLYPELADLKYINYSTELRNPKYGAILHGTPGLTRLFTTENGSVRGLLEYNNVLYIVSGNALYTYTPNGPLTSVGTLLTNNTPVQMTINFDGQILITDTVTGYVYVPVATTAHVIEQITTTTALSAGDTTVQVSTAITAQGVAVLAGQSVIIITDQGTQFDGTITGVDATTNILSFTPAIPSGYTVAVGNTITTYSSYSANTLNQIPDPNFLAGAQSCTFLQGFGIVCNNEFFALSLADDFFTWPVFYISGLGNYQDLVQSVYSNRASLELWIFGLYHTEVWFNSGSTTQVFPLASKSFINIDTGTAAPQSVVQANGTLYWLSKDIRGRCYFVTNNNYSYQIVSSDAINAAITSYVTVSDCIGYVYQDAGHEFIVWTFPTQDVTWVYDTLTQLWHQRSSLINFTGNPTQTHRHVSNCHAYFNNQHIVGDWLTGYLYTMTLAAYTDAGTPIIRERTSGFQQNDLKQMSIYSFQIDVQSGVGNSQEPNPYLIFNYSKDFGRTWSADRHLPLGSAGQYLVRARTTSLGLGRTWNFKLRYSGNTEIHIMNAQITATEGSN